MKPLVCLALWALLAGSAEAQTVNTVPDPGEGQRPPATIADMAWLAGEWTGTGLGGVSEETWAPPADGAMMGMYRLVVNGKVSFYEFMNLREENGSLVLKLKHFNPDLTPWEEKERWVQFPLAKMTAGEAWFGGLTFRRVDDRTLHIFLALRGRDGTLREERFEMRRR